MGEAICSTHLKFASFLFKGDNAAAQRVPTHLLYSMYNTYKERARGQDLCTPCCLQGAFSASKQENWSISAFKELHVASSHSQCSTTGG